FARRTFDHRAEQNVAVVGIDKGLPGRASFYDPVTPYSPDGRRVSSPPNNFSGRWASGGFVSTVDDPVRFANALMPGSGRLPVHALKLIQRPESGLPPIGKCGLGWMTGYDLHGRPVHFHFGAGSGATALLVIWPKQRVAVAIMSNLGHARLPFNR